MSVERKGIIGIRDRVVSKLRRTETQSHLSSRDKNILVGKIEPASGLKLEQYEKECQDILDKEESFSPEDFNKFNFNMILILGAEESVIGEENSNLISFEDRQDTLEGSIQFIRRFSGEKNLISIGYNISVPIENYPCVEEVYLEKLFEEYGDDYFANVDHFFLPENMKAPDFKYKSVTQELKIDFPIPNDYTDLLSKKDTVLFLRRTYDIYENWRDNMNNSTTQV